MTPMKNASSETKSAASAMKQTTRLNALETGFDCTTTDAAKSSISTAKIQNRPGVIGGRKGSRRREKGRKGEGGNCLLDGVPLVDEARLQSADFVEFLFVVHHLGAGRPGDSIILHEVDGLLWADL